MDKPWVALCHPSFETDVKQSLIQRVYSDREMIVQLVQRPSRKSSIRANSGHIEKKDWTAWVYWNPSWTILRIKVIKPVIFVGQTWLQRLSDCTRVAYRRRVRQRYAADVLQLEGVRWKNVCRQARTPLLQFSDDLPEPTKTCCNIPSNLQKAHIQGLNQTVQTWSSPLFPFICFHRNLKSLCYGLYCDRRSATEWWRGNYDWQTLSFQNPYILTRRESCSIRSGGGEEMILHPSESTEWNPHFVVKQAAPNRLIYEAHGWRLDLKHSDNHIIDRSKRSSCSGVGQLGITIQ